MTTFANTTQRSWRQIGWNGVGFSTPADWEPVKIGSQYLMFENDTGPTMELKWNTVRGVFSHKASLRKLGAGHSRALRKSLRLNPIPESWQQALQRYETTGFVWQTANSSGRGAILYCRRCRRATLIQFLQTADQKNDQPWVERILASYADHSEQPTVLWTIFDIHARLPRGMALKHHRFYTGTFELEFELGKNTFGLHRWAPADALLQRTGLHGFASKWTARYTNHQLALASDGPDALAAAVPPVATHLGRGLAAIRRSPRLQFVRIWHVAHKNRILGVRAQGRRLPDVDLLEGVCRDFKAI